MRTENDWLLEVTKICDCDGTLTAMGMLIQRIQSDASRSAARSERERCAFIVETRGQTITGLEYRIDAAKAKLLADDLRALPDDNALGADDKGGKPA